MEFLFSFRHYVCALDAYSLLRLHLAPLDGWIGSSSRSITRTILRHRAAAPMAVPAITAIWRPQLPLLPKSMP